MFLLHIHLDEIFTEHSLLKLGVISEFEVTVPGLEPTAM